MPVMNNLLKSKSCQQLIALSKCKNVKSLKSNLLERKILVAWMVYENFAVGIYHFPIYRNLSTLSSRTIVV